ncbi:MAG: C40 family peptidase [Bacteroidales bacterium]|jgi:cell wall-associated NlpC family hydrolase|nr:C40 family peptidase [Bacteroidales bacterium]
MEHGFCNLAVIPMRKEPNNTSELVSQLLFGETFDIIDTEEDRSLIKTHHDFYEGWISNKQFISINEKELDIQKKTKKIFCAKPVTKIKQINLTNGSISLIPVTLGATFAGYSFNIGDYGYSITREKTSYIYYRNVKHLIFTSKILLNAPYLWGGRSILGIDCSGFTQLCFRFIGVKLYRDASQQAKQGRLINESDIKAGDLCFFSEYDSNNISHTGIYLGNEQIIHSCGKVRIDDFPLNTHKLIVIKRMFDAEK